MLIPAIRGDAIIGINFGGALGNPSNPNLIANNLIYDFQSAHGHYGIVAQYGGSYLNIVSQYHFF